MQVPAGKPSIAIKPTVDTPFHIDYAWFDRAGEDLRREILSQLTPDQRERLPYEGEPEMVDFVDPETGEVITMDAITGAVAAAARDESFINPNISVIDSVFRAFLANDNAPMSANELAERIGKPARTILGAISGRQVYKGIRPVSQS
jgi:hypothetical protein